MHHTIAVLPIIEVNNSYTVLANLRCLSGASQYGTRLQFLRIPHSSFCVLQLSFVQQLLRLLRFTRSVLRICSKHGSIATTQFHAQMLHNTSHKQTHRTLTGLRFAILRRLHFKNASVHQLLIILRACSPAIATGLSRFFKKTRVQTLASHSSCIAPLRGYLIQHYGRYSPPLHFVPHFGALWLATLPGFSAVTTGTA